MVCCAMIFDRGRLLLAIVVLRDFFMWWWLKEEAFLVAVGDMVGEMRVSCTLKNCW